MELVIAEKPSVARDIARVLGATGRGEGCLRGPSHVVTWCIGHLVELEEPATYNEAWKSWKLSVLPMVPERFKLRPSKGTLKQWGVVRDLLRSRDFEAVINACDAGREGELIFRFCYELAGSRLPVRRLWISSMTDAALRSGFASLRPGAQYDALADAARCRAEADWLVGMNATRAVTTRFRAGGGDALFSVGRVQTPTLALVVEREHAIQRFVPRDYWEVSGQFSTPEGSFKATWMYLGQSRLGALALAQQLVARLDGQRGTPHGPRVESLEKKTERQPPPLLFDLTTLQRTANKRYGMSAQRTLDVAQALYETHKLITYPRTDSRHLSTDLRNELPNIFRALTQSPPHAAFAQPLLATPPGPTPRVFNNGRVTDHHAIIPTSKAPTARLDHDEERLYDLIVRRFLGAFYPDAEFALTTLVIAVGAPAPPPPMPDPVPPRDTILGALPPPTDRLHARGKVQLKAGWREVAGFDDPGEGPEPRGEDDEQQNQRLPPLARDQRLDGRFDQTQKKTRPPPRYTEATLLSAMEFAGREIDDETLRHALKDRGLGTPATRASVIETLLKRGFVERRQKNVVPTALGVSLVDGLPVRSLASAELTGEWEARLARMARAEEQRERFMNDIVGYIRETVEQVRSSALPASLGAGAGASGPPIGHCPLCQNAVVETFKAFGCQRCPFKIWKTIAGKTISARLAALLLQRRRSSVLSGFRNRAGTAFQAAIEIDTSGQVRLSFASGPAAASDPTAAPGVPAAPSADDDLDAPQAAEASHDNAPPPHSDVPDDTPRWPPASGASGKKRGSRSSGSSTRSKRRGTSAVSPTAAASSSRSAAAPSRSTAPSRSAASPAPSRFAALPPADLPPATSPSAASPSAASPAAASPPAASRASAASPSGGGSPSAASHASAALPAPSTRHAPSMAALATVASDAEAQAAEAAAAKAAAAKAAAEAAAAKAAAEAAAAEAAAAKAAKAAASGAAASASAEAAAARGAPAGAAAAEAAAAAEPGAESDETPPATLYCPHCGQGTIVTGKRAWGCSRWREGCRLVVPFSVGGKQLTINQLRELIMRGRTSRRGSWTLDGQPIKGRLRLDLGTEPPSVAIDEG